MADLSSLTREQLLALLQQKEATSSQSASTKQTRQTKKDDHADVGSAVGGSCRYTPVRSNQPPCADLSISEWGFCKKHSRTVQAKKAQEKWEEEEQTRSNKISDKPSSSSILDIDADIGQVDKVEVAEQLANINAQQVKGVRTRVQEEVVKVTPSSGKGTRSSEKAKEIVSAKKPSVTPVKGVRKPVVQKKVIRPNFWGRFEDTETHIVFDPTTKTAYGVQDPTGKVIALSANHIAICERNGWNYNAPDGDSETEEAEDSEEAEGSEGSEEEAEGSEGSEEEAEGSEEDEEEEWDDEAEGSEDEEEAEGSDEEEEDDEEEDEEDDEEEEEEEDEEEDDEEEDEEEEEDEDD